MKQPLVSAIIPNYNYARFLRQAIDGALAQTYKNIEVIVVDDGSSDDSETVLRFFSDRIKWVKQTNQGVSAARNRAVAESAGEILAFLDADDIWLPEKIEKQVRVFAAGEKIGLVHCGAVDFDAAGNLLSEHLDGMSGAVSRDLLEYRRDVILGGGSAAAVTREAFEKVGGFDTNLRIGEDWEFYYRVAKNFRVGFVPEILLKYRIHSNNSFAGNASSVERMETDMLLAYDKIFAAADEDEKKIKNRCYGRIHTIIAGSYFRIGQYSKFLEHTVKGARYAPDNLTRYAGFPLRWLRRRF